MHHLCAAAAATAIYHFASLKVQCSLKAGRAKGEVFLLTECVLYWLPCTGNDWWMYCVYSYDYSPSVQVQSSALVFLQSTLQTSGDTLLQNSIEDSEASKKVRVCKHNFVYFFARLLYLRKRYRYVQTSNWGCYTELSGQTALTRGSVHRK